MSLVVTYTAANTSALTIDFSALDAGEDMTIDLSDAEVDGVTTIITGAGDDAITLGDGADIVQIAFGGQGVDTLTTFVGGTHVIDLAGTSDVADAAGADLDLDGFLAQDANASHVLVDGLTVFGSDNQKTAVDAGATLTAAEIATYFADVGAAGGNQTVTVSTAADVAYVLVQGAAGAATLAKVTGGADTTIDTADVTLIAHFAALDTDTVTAANFSDFA